MRSRPILFTLVLSVIFFMLPDFVYAKIPFYGPIIPPEQATCPGGWGLFVTVINNIISLLITLVITAVAPLMIAYAGFLWVVNPLNPSERSEAKNVLWKAVIGIVVSLSAWLIVNAMLVVLLPEDGSVQDGRGGFTKWYNIITTDGTTCLNISSPPTSGQQPPSGQPSVAPPPPSSGGVPPDGRFDYQGGIAAQIPTASASLNTLLSCMAAIVPGNVGQISSISDSWIISGKNTWDQCRGGLCQHSANSCHYGGRSCGDQSFAVDFGDEVNTTVLTSAASQCGARTNFEGNHLHVSVGAANGCGCDARL